MTTETKILMSSLNSSLCPNKMKKEISKKFGALERQVEEYQERQNSSVTVEKVLTNALELIITWNRDHARDQYGDPDKAESWACVREARKAIEYASSRRLSVGIAGVDQEKVFLAMKAACGIKE